MRTLKSTILYQIINLILFYGGKISLLVWWPSIVFLLLLVAAIITLIVARCNQKVAILILQAMIQVEPPQSVTKYAEFMNLTNTQEYINYEDELNKISVKDHN